MTDYTPVSFKLDNEVLADLKAAAVREDRTQTAIVERALRAYIAASKAADEPDPALADLRAIREARTSTEAT